MWTRGCIDDGHDSDDQLEPETPLREVRQQRSSPHGLATYARDHSARPDSGQIPDGVRRWKVCGRMVSE